MACARVPVRPRPGAVTRYPRAAADDGAAAARAAADPAASRVPLVRLSKVVAARAQETLVLYGLLGFVASIGTYTAKRVRRCVPARSRARARSCWRRIRTAAASAGAGAAAPAGRRGPLLPAGGAGRVRPAGKQAAHQRVTFPGAQHIAQLTA